MFERINIVKAMINELSNSENKNTEIIRKYLILNEALCNEVLYTDPKYKESSIILTHIFKNLTLNLGKEITNVIFERSNVNNE